MPQAQAYDTEGLPIPAEQTAEAVQAGQAAFTKGAAVYMRDPVTGNDVSMPAESAAEAARNGYTVLPADYVAAQERQARDRAEYGSGTAALQAGAEGALRGASFGFSDQVLADFGMREGLAKRKELNPNAALAGEVAGTVAPMLLSGGAGAAGAAARTLGAAPLAVARAAGAVERGALALLRGGGKTVAGRLGAKAASVAAGGALEGAAYGAGQQISQAALLDEELTAEKLLSGAGQGALFGAAGGAALGAAQAGAARLLGAKGISSRLSEKAEALAFKQATGNSAKHFDQALAFGGQERIQRIGRKMLDRGVPLRKLDDAAAAVKAQVQEAGTKMQAVIRQLDDAGEKVSSRELLSRVDEQIAQLSSSKIGDIRSVARRLERQVKPLREAPESMSFQEMWDVRRQLDKTISWSAKQQNPATEALREMRTTFDDHLTKSVEASKTSGAGKTWRAAKEDYSDFLLAADALKEHAKRRAKNRSISPTDYLTGGAAGVAASILSTSGAALPAIATGAATSVAHKIVREQGAGVAATMLDRLSKANLRLDAAAQQISGRIKISTKRTVVPATAALVSRFEATRQDLERTIAEPIYLQKKLTSLTGGLEREHPGLAGVMQDRVMGDAQYLQSQIPSGYTPASMTPEAVRTMLGKPAMAEFMAKVEALDDPILVLEKIADGEVDLAQIEALKVRRPKIYENIRNKVMIFASQRGSELPYADRVRLGAAFDFVSDDSLRPEMMATIQASLAAAKQQAAGPQPQRAMKTDTQNTLTPSQKAAS